MEGQEGGQQGQPGTEEQGQPGSGGEQGGSQGQQGQVAGQETGSQGVATIPLRLTPEQIAKVQAGEPIEVPATLLGAGAEERVGQLTRQLRGTERQLSKLTAAQEEQNRANLAEQGKYKELYEGEQASRAKAEERLQQTEIRAEFRLAALKAGVVDPEGAYLLVQALPEWAAVKHEEDGSIAGLAAALKALTDAKPYLVQQQKQKPTQVGSGSNPADPGKSAPPKDLREASDRFGQELQALANS